AFGYLNDGKVDLIAMNLEKNIERSDEASFSLPLGKMSTVLIGNESVGKITSWDQLSSDTIYVREGAVYKNQLCNLKDSLKLNYTIIPTPDHEETLID